MHIFMFMHIYIVYIYGDIYINVYIPINIYLHASFCIYIFIYMYIVNTLLTQRTMCDISGEHSDDTSQILWLKWRFFVSEYFCNFNARQGCGVSKWSIDCGDTTENIELIARTKTFNLWMSYTQRNLFEFLLN